MAEERDLYGLDEDAGMDAANEEAAMKIIAFTSAQMVKRQEAVEGRAACGVERQWREAELAYDGLDTSSGPVDMIHYATGDAYIQPQDDARRSQVVVNISRSKAETATGRFSEILLPVDDANFGLKVTPKPDLVEAMADDTPLEIEGGQPELSDGSQLTVSDAAKKEMEEAERRMEGMQTLIEDQLNECSFNGECRKAVASACKIGTGILKGPFVTKKIRKAWTAQTDESGEVWDMQMKEELTPESKFVDPWDVYPDPNCYGEIKHAAYIWERDTILPRELRQLIGVPGFLQDQIELVLKDEPKRTVVNYSKGGKHQLQQNCSSLGSSYERWYYHGDVSVDDLATLGMDVDELEAASYSCCVEFVNDRPIRVTLNAIDSGELPYDFFQWIPVTGSVWGIGVVTASIWQQRVITAAWRCMMDNAGDSSGANVIIGQGVEPADKVMEVTGKKLWYANEEVEDVRKALYQFQITNNQAELQNIIDLALRFMDMETQIPMIFQGETQKMPDTLGQTNIMVDSNNVAFRTRVKLWDDKITRPHMTRYYYYNMLYSDDPNVKGDFSVDPRGTTVLLARDQQGQATMELMPLKGDPDMSVRIDWQKMTEQLLKAKKLDVLLPQEEVDRKLEEMSKQPPPVDPAVEAAKIRAETELQKANTQHEHAMHELEAKERMASEQRSHEMEMKTADLQIAMMGYAEQKDMKLQDIKADLTKEAGKLNLQRELAGPDKKGPQVATPTVEPEGRAAPGRAFQD